MKTRTQSSFKQRGFSLLTGFILAIIMFGSLAFFLAGSGIGTSFGASFVNTSKVSSLLTSAGYISTGFDAVVLGGQSPYAVTFDSGSTGIFNPTIGGSSLQPLDQSLFQLRDTTTVPGTPQIAATDGYWFYRIDTTTTPDSPVVKLNGIGTTGLTSASNEYVIMTSGLKDTVCAQINTTLHGSSTIPGVTPVDAALVGAPTRASPTSLAAVDLSATGGIVGWMNGCVQSGTAGNYVYFHTLLAQ